MFKLYVIFVLFSIGCAIGAQQYKQYKNLELSPSQKNRIRYYEAECIKETGVNPEVAKQATKGRFRDNKGLKEFAICFFQKSGIFSQDEKVNMDAALSILPAGVNKVALAKVLEICKNKPGRTHADTAFNFAICYMDAIDAIWI